ncbi:MAG: mechanosensitive ion channel [Synergistaceae bacterium]|nr:mechanosensitive ion channel [Synergistaceae bacterium]
MNKIYKRAGRRITGVPLALALLLLCFVLVLSAGAQPEENGEKKAWLPPADQEAINHKVQEVRQEKEILLSRKAEGLYDEEAETELQSLLLTLGTLENAYTRYSTTLGSTAVASEGAGEGDIKEKELLQRKPPYTLSTYDETQNRYEIADQRLKTVTSTLNALEGMKGKLQDGVAQAEERKNRLARSSEASPLEFRRLEVELEIARINQAIQKINFDDSTKKKKTYEEKKKNLADAVEKVRSNLEYDEADRKEHNDHLDEQTTLVRKNVEELQKARDKIRADLLRSQGVQNSVRTEKDRLIAEAKTAELEAQFRLNQAAIELNEQKLTFLDETRKIWNIRYDLIKGALSSEKLWEIRSTVTERLKELENSFQVKQNAFVASQADLLAAQKELEKAELPQISASLRNRINSLSKMTEIITESVSGTFNLLRQYNRLQAEMNSEFNTLRIAEKVTSYGKDRFLSVWNTTLWSGEGFNVTVAKVVLAVLLFGMAFLFSGRITDFLSRKILVRFGMDSSVAQAVRKIIFYILMATFLLSALDLIGIPLTAFAFLGGALAIGIGFGAQNIFNNLISGFILMFSKPIKMNDIIEVDGLYATVQEIGSRATLVKTFDNIDVLVPNSYFLNNKIINWTHTDQKMRVKVTVGVSYGSDVREVERLLYKAVNEHTRVLKNPEPFVLFREFGTNSLDFIIYFWIDMAVASTVKVPSDIRYRLVALFADAGITIAFPQMDVHLDSATPLAFRMQGAAEETREATPEE